MDYRSSQESSFLKTVESWIAEGGEVLAEFCYSHTAGSRDWEFFTAIGAFRDRISQLPPRTLVSVFRKSQLPLRGVIDDDFISQAMSMVADGEEYLAAALDKVQYGNASWYHHDAGQTHEEMKCDLEDARGTRVAFGSRPIWEWESEDISVAIVPLEDGRVEVGVY